MSIINTERNLPDKKDASIKSEEDPFQKIFTNLKQKDEDIRDLKLEILSLKDRVKGSNISHTSPTHNVIHKLNIDLLRFDRETN